MELLNEVAGAFRSLAGALSDAGERADAASLCEGWSVRNVLAHMTMAARYDEDAFMADLRDVGFDFERLSNRIAARDGALPFDELLADLRSDAMARWVPPQGGAAGALTHVVIHGLDVTVALGLPRTASDEAMRLVLDSLTAGGVHRHFGTSIDGVRLCAADLDWAYGSGRTVVCDAQDLALALCGRRVPKVATVWSVRVS
jgi:uncharacterized protein (TIGR03083 family)